MKNMKITAMGLAIAATAMLSFTELQQVGIKGKVTPAEGAVKAWAISTTDTLKSPITDGTFQFDSIQPGVYRIIVEATAPYKHAAKDSVVVTAAQVTDIGEISLQTQ